MERLRGSDDGAAYLFARDLSEPKAKTDKMQVAIITKIFSEHHQTQQDRGPAVPLSQMYTAAPTPRFF